MTQRIEDQMRTNMKKQVEAKQAEAKAQDVRSSGF